MKSQANHTQHCKNQDHHPRHTVDSLTMRAALVSLMSLAKVVSACGLALPPSVQLMARGELGTLDKRKSSSMVFF